MPDLSNNLKNGSLAQCLDPTPETGLHQPQSFPQMSAAEMMQCIVRVQAWVKLTRTRDKLTQQLKHPPSHPIWAGAMNLPQAELLEQLLQGQQAKQALVEMLTPWVIEVIADLQTPLSSRDSLTQVGLNSLEQAIEEFDPTQSVAFMEHIHQRIRAGLAQVNHASVEYVASNSATQSPSISAPAPEKKAQNAQGSSKITCPILTDMPMNLCD